MNKIRKSVIAVALTAISGANFAANPQNQGVFSKPQEVVTVQPVFGNKSPEITTIVTPSVKTTSPLVNAVPRNTTTSVKTTPLQDDAIRVANGNNSNSNQVFAQRYGAQPSANNVLIEQTDRAKVQNRLSDMEKQNVLLKQELENTKRKLNETNSKLSKAEKLYGEVPASEKTAQDGVPSVPKTVLTGTPKYNANANSSGTNIKVTPGVNQIITISTDQPNRIITPFMNPQILSSSLEGGTGKKCGEVCVKGNVVYISTKKDYPLGLFITEKGQEQTAISLTLVPRRIPPREVNLILNDSNSLTMQGAAESKVWETTQPFVNTLKKTILGIALGEIPNGYHLQKIPKNYALPVCNQTGLNISFGKGQLLAGTNLNYVVGKITNVSNVPIEFTESSCGGYDVAAVAAYPYNLLQPKQSTEVYVVQRVNANQKKIEKKRRSLLTN